MLRIVLAEKGVPMGAHYDVHAQSRTSSETPVSAAPPNAVQADGNPLSDGPLTTSVENGDEGVYL